MAASYSFSVAQRSYQPYSSSSESLLLSRVKLPFGNKCLVPVSFTTQRAAHLSLKRFGSSVHQEKCVKVLCVQEKDIPVLEAGSMDDIYDALVQCILPAATSNPNLKYIVGLAGPPGAGKSTLASEVVQRINRLWPLKTSSFDSQVTPPEVAAVLPMDGFHLYRSQLDAMENPEEAHARRGAPWTFAPQLLFKCLEKLRNEGSVYVPSFDHGVGDPVEDDIFVSPQHKVVIVEGNYILLEEDFWKDISSMFDEKWFIDVDIDTAMRRVLKRHISTGKPADVAKWRIEYNDKPNAELIIKSKQNADLIIKSIDF